MDFSRSIPQKITGIGYFGASNDQEVFWGNWAVEASEVVKAAEVSKAWKITSEDFQVLEFNNLVTNINLFLCFENKIFDRIMKTHFEF